MNLFSNQCFFNHLSKPPTCWFLLTVSWRRPLSYRNQSIDLLCKSMDWFLYNNSLRHEWVKQLIDVVVSLYFLTWRKCPFGLPCQTSFSGVSSEVSVKEWLGYFQYPDFCKSFLHNTCHKFGTKHNLDMKLKNRDLTYKGNMMISKMLAVTSWP